jgi:hypothetical protein
VAVVALMTALPMSLQCHVLQYHVLQCHVLHQFDLGMQSQQTLQMVVSTH